MGVTRRALDFGSLDEVAAEVQRLRGVAVVQAGQWTLGEICGHLDRFMGYSMDGFPFRLPWLMRLPGPLVLWWTLRRRWIPAGIKAPPALAPEPARAPGDAVDRFLATLDRYQQFEGPLHPSPMFGRLNRATWDQVHLIHCAHHLGFIAPAPGTESTHQPSLPNH